MVEKTSLSFFFILLGALTSCSSSSSQKTEKDLLLLDGYNKSWVKPFSRVSPQQNFYLRWPLKKVRISQLYRPSQNQDHYGIDFAARENTPIYAAHDAYVLYVGHWGSFGNMILLQYDNVWSTLYAHLNDSFVQQGQIIQTRAGYRSYR